MFSHPNAVQRTRVQSLTQTLLLLVGLALCSSPSQAKVIEDDGLPEPAALQCPDWRSTTRKPAASPRKAANASVSTPMPEREDGDDIGDAPNLSTVKPMLDLRAGKTSRVALWGDSHAAAGFFSEGLIQGLGLSVDEVQPSYLPASFGLPGVRLPVRKTCLGPGWTRSHAYRTPTRNADFPISLTVAGTDQNDSYAWLDFRTQPQPKGLESIDVVLTPPDSSHSTTSVLAVSINDAPENIVALDRVKDPVLQLRSAHGVMTVKIRLISGELTLAGLVPHYAHKPKLILDTFGIPGATARGWEAVDTGHLRATAQAEPYDVVLMAFGTNEGNDAHYDPVKYTDNLRIAVKNLRATYPGASCILVGPTDRGRSASSGRAASGVGHHARIHRSITSAQRRVADEQRCQFWDWQFHMGGPGGAHAWLRQNPPLMAGDLIHLTPQGYRLSGQMLGKQLSGR